MRVGPGEVTLEGGERVAPGSDRPPWPVVEHDVADEKQLTSPSSAPGVNRQEKASSNAGALPSAS